MTSAAAARYAHRVLVVRQWDEPASGSGCCGGTSALSPDLCRPEDLADARARKDAMGSVYRALRRALPDTDITLVDVRNWAWLVPAVVRDGRRHGLSWAAVGRQVVRATAPGSIVVDGVVVSTGGVPDPAGAVEAVVRQMSPGEPLVGEPA